MYLEKRNALLAEVETAIAANDFETSKLKRDEIEKLDKDFQVASEEKANLNALKENAQVVNLENNKVEVEGVKLMEQTQNLNSTVNYDDVFAKVALKRELSKDEIEVFNRMNPENVYTHDTTNTEIVIPETVIAGIESTMKELHPILADVRTTSIKGTVKYAKHTAIPQGDADYYDEATATADEENTFGELVLGGKELSKAVTVTWKLQAMAVSDFIPFLQRELGERMSYAKANAFIRGAGDAKYPQGVITALNAQSETPQVITYTKDALTYVNVTAAMGAVSSKHVSGAKIYANNKTVWGTLANLLDGQNSPLFIPDVTSGGVGRIFGIPVKEEDGMENGEILIANMATGYKANTQEPMKLVTEQHAKTRKTDFVGYEVHDGGVSDETAFALLTVAPGV